VRYSRVEVSRWFHMSLPDLSAAASTGPGDARSHAATGPRIASRNPFHPGWHRFRCHAERLLFTNTHPRATPSAAGLAALVTLLCCP
jgi:hypothetical protein